MMKKGKTCKYCKHIYVHPCNGQDNTCPNLVWIKSGGKIDPYDLSTKQIAKLKKTGKLPPLEEIAAKPRKKVKKRKRLVTVKPIEDQPVKKKRKRLRKRLRLTK